MENNNSNTIGQNNSPDKSTNNMQSPSNNIPSQPSPTPAPIPNPVANPAPAQPIPETPEREPVQAPASISSAKPAPLPNTNSTNAPLDNQNTPIEQPVGLPQGNPYSKTPEQAPISEKNVPPPPENIEDKVAIRTMQSDMESIKETGGSAPESQIVAAPEINAGEIQKQQTQEQLTETQPTALGAISESQSQPSKITPSPKPQASGTKTKINTKTILIISGIAVLAIAIGIAVYYLVSSLHSTPQLPSNKQNSGSQLPIDLNGGNNNNDNNQQPKPDENNKPSAFTHISLLTSPDDKVNAIIPAATLTYIKEAISSSTNPTLSEKQVRDITFVQKTASTSEIQIESPEIIQSFFPNIATKLFPLFDKDYTAWIYFDKVEKISPKFGLILKLKDNVTIDSASSTVADIENYPDLIANLFIDTVTTPADPTFDDGVVNDIKVRFLQFSKGNVFEYGWVTSGKNSYLVMTTSYKQMVDITSRLLAK